MRLLQSISNMVASAHSENMNGESRREHAPVACAVSKPDLSSCCGKAAVCAEYGFIVQGLEYRGIK
jgi:hypothetical protein